MSDLLDDLELAGIRLDVDPFLFEDACTITRTTDQGTVNTITGELESPTSLPIYTGTCSLYPIESRRDRFDEFGQGLIYTRQYRVVLPYDVPEILIRDIFTLTASDDPQAVGRPMEVRDVILSTNLGYRRLTVQDVRE